MSTSSASTALQYPIICIVGPTASGKSELAQRVALARDGEVVSADSMQVYRGMDIGTGKVLAKDRLVPHHCLDIVDPGQPFSAALFQETARACFSDIDARGHRAVLCGGTGFYVRAAIDDYQFPKGEQVGNARRDACLAFAHEHGADALWQRLAAEDPQSAALIPPNDVKRVTRAFELLDDGTTYAQQKQKLAHIPQKYPAVFVGLHVEPAVLRQRIDARVDAMVEQGLVAEVQGLLDGGFRQAITSPQAIGYKEIVDALKGRCTLGEAVEQIKTATHRYAKRQRTWFRKDARINWIDATSLNAGNMLEDALRYVEAHCYNA